MVQRLVPRGWLHGACVGHPVLGPVGERPAREDGCQDRDNKRPPRDRHQAGGDVPHHGRGARWGG